MASDYKARDECKTLEDWLDYWHVDESDDFFHPDRTALWGGPRNWWGVSNEDEGIVAYFMREEDAFRFRLAEINRALNG